MISGKPSMRSREEDDDTVRKQEHVILATSS